MFEDKKNTADQYLVDAQKVFAAREKGEAVIGPSNVECKDTIEKATFQREQVKLFAKFATWPQQYGYRQAADHCHQEHQRHRLPASGWYPLQQETAGFLRPRW